ncbi:LLM class F420-dependent oxidoreductase [Parahaliea sp. F7430]|uniref:LLM class F420-dependent oxidoreductase n=1 Tax=Sediminihaliea albiluteola TaxID=2758564 RepID=A0A7W2TYA1_9GAMM|nr:LLM class F420-dependent oxidoreductase [Sediminihaliea albiluteola]MBA6414146.1 LLM class F420-dependent oxidoreductase [Sediminihaliea albiluteola]
MKFVIPMAFSNSEELIPLAQAADEAGWDAISFSDHIVNPEKINTPYPYTESGERRWDAFSDWPDPWVAVGACAAATKRLRFTSNVFVLPIRNPFIAAKAISTAAVLSNNRVTLTIGVGWSKDEYQLMGQDFHSRGKRCNEILEILPLLWSGKMVEYHGEFYDFDRLEMNPAPTQPIPIWVGGISEAAHRRAARLGNGWLSDLQSSEEILATVQAIKQYRVEYGREKESFDVMASANDAWEIEGYKRLHEGGVTHLLTMPWVFYHGEQATLEQKIDGIKRFADDIIAQFR